MSEQLGIHEIMKSLPHRYPFLLVDRIIETDWKERIVGIKNLTINEPFFQGHFPGDPVMPGVLQLEAMAQVGGILLNKVAGREGIVAYFLGIDGAKFRKILRPGDQMRIEVTMVKHRLNIARTEGKIFVGDELASEGKLMFGYNAGS